MLWSQWERICGFHDLCMIAVWAFFRLCGRLCRETAEQGAALSGQVTVQVQTGWAQQRAWGGRPKGTWRWSWWDLLVGRVWEQGEETSPPPTPRYCQLDPGQVWGPDRLGMEGGRVGSHPLVSGDGSGWRCLCGKVRVQE